MVFVQMKNEFLFDILEIMDEKGFYYVENMTIAYLDYSKA